MAHRPDVVEAVAAHRQSPRVAERVLKETRINLPYLNKRFATRSCAETENGQRIWG